LKTNIRSSRIAIVLCFLLGVFFTRIDGTFAADKPDRLRVMSFNLWHGGDAGGQPLSKSVEVIRKARADIVGLQETEGHSQAGSRPDHAVKLAKQLGWHYLNQGDRTGIISRYPILKSTPRKWGAEIQLPSGETVYLFNAHFAHAPYQPYQLLKIPYHNGAFLKTEGEAIAAAQAARGAQVARMLAEIEEVKQTQSPIFITGDFNEPSHLDWTDSAVEAELCPVKVQWPTTHNILRTGFVDGYRSRYPDPVKHPGVTWTPLTKPSDPKDHHDRIDFVLCSKQGAKIIDANVIGEAEKYADIVVKNYPSDHRAVVVEIELTRIPSNLPME